MKQIEIAHELDRLASVEFASVKKWIESTPHPVLWLIEICRVTDYHSVMQAFSHSTSKLAYPDFEILLKGWNATLGLLLPHSKSFTRGFPIMPSSVSSRQLAATILHQMGRSVLLAESAGRMRAGMLTGSRTESGYQLSMSDVARQSHFLDQMERVRFRDRFGEQRRMKDFLDRFKIDNLRRRLADLSFAWPTPHGTMIGYGAELDIDNYFLGLVGDACLDWRDEAGLHPNARIGDLSGSDVAAVGLLLMSAYLKHIQQVDAGCVRFPEANYHMSLTIWKPSSELARSIADFTGLDHGTVAQTLDMFTVRPSDSMFFAKSRTPFLPMLIEVSDYVVSPVSSIFRNPFSGLKSLLEFRRPDISAAIARHREDWMISELVHLFLGDRYRFVDKPARLRREGNPMTDIDAAVLDRTTGSLGLFQLKWQDFDTDSIREQKSKAKNFVEDVDRWGESTKNWVADYGTAALCNSLRLKLDHPEQISEVLLFAIGRIVARFGSYGLVPKQHEIAVATWQQFVRLRHDIGPVKNVLLTLHGEMQREARNRVEKTPIPHTITSCGETIVFENVWNQYIIDESDSEPKVDTD